MKTPLPRLYLRLVTAIALLLAILPPLHAQTGPLLTTRHGFQRPYNRLCPYWLYDWGALSPTRTQAGCVASAAEQVVTYYRRPVTLLDTIHGWTTPHYTIADILPGETIETAHIRDAYTEADDSATTADVARLMYVLACAARMNFGLEASGSSLRRLVEPMHRVFGYGRADFVDSYDYTADDWERLLADEIHAGRPVVYVGYTQHLGGHAFVIDGVDEERGLYHLNWGYDGQYDGWFLLDMLSFAEPLDEPTEDGRVEGFFCNHQALLLCPDSVADALPPTYPRTGREFSLSDITFEAEPLTGRYTPVRLTVTNTANTRLTAPFEFFTNLPTDTALFAQGDYNGLSGVTLDPGESRILRLHLQFDEGGERIFRASPDDSTLLCAVPISIGTAPAADITFGQPTVTFPSDGTVEIRQPYTNSPDGGRAGCTVTYEIYDPSAPSAAAPRHYYHLYAATGETVCDTVRFASLHPGHTYTYRLREPWEVQVECTFTVPLSTGIGAVTSYPASDRTTIYYDLQGRPVARPERPGIYIIGGRKVVI
ncbi:MAG: C10 family peptidase [Bacteroidaceae bacterium]|nr:C10 family peptidase [Bacteroidaceae bacterium]